MICNKYKLNNDEVILLYTKLDKIEQPKIFDALQIQLIEENVDIASDENKMLPIYEYEQLILSTFKKRTSDKKLEEVGISSFYDLQTAYFLIKVKGLNQPKSIRDLVEEKYTTVIDLILPN